MPLKTLNGGDAAPRKGRGAGVNPEGRFETLGREAVDDGWNAVDEEPRTLKTHITIEQAKSIISHNDSPDVGFSQSINPYAGCEHGCGYCVQGDTQLLMTDGSTRRIAEVRVGDEIYGTSREGWYRRYVKSRVLAHWSVIKFAHRVMLEDGTELIASADHRFLTERGWKYVGNAGLAEWPYLTVNDKLMGTGGFAARAVTHEGEYRRGYLCGMVRGDAHLASREYRRSNGPTANVHRFRLALCTEALDRTRNYLNEVSVATQEFEFQQAIGGRRAMQAIRTQKRANVDGIRDLIKWPLEPTRSWAAGFLAGIFDAEGSYGHNVLRISNSDAEIIDWITRCMESFGFRCTVEDKPVEQGRRPMRVVRLDGGLPEHLRFFHTVDPAIRRKLDITGHAVETDARLGVVSIEPVGTMRLYDITTETEDFIANGVVSHNCFARPSHGYRNLSPGIDFETRIFAKTNAAELLRKELSKPSYKCSVIAIGVNTDAYQPIERELKITRSILEVCAEFNQPVGLITKNATIERDIDIIAPMAHKRLATVTISLNNLDHDLARRLEPRCAAPSRRLQVMRTLSSAGIPVRVLMAPVIPFITDHQIERVLEAAREHGATRAGYVLLRLPWEVREVFIEWLERHYPLKAKHVMSRIHDMRGGRDNDPRFGSRMTGAGELAQLLGKRFEIASRRLGFEDDEHEPLATSLFRVPSGGASQMSLF